MTNHQSNILNKLCRANCVWCLRCMPLSSDC